MANSGLLNFGTTNARISQPETVLPILGSNNLTNMTVANNQFTYSVSETVLLNIAITMGVINDNTTAKIEIRDITAGLSVASQDFGVMGGSIINTPTFFFAFQSVAGHAYSIRMKSYGGASTQLTISQATMYSTNFASSNDSGPSFANITSGTNTTAAMVVGTGATFDINGGTSTTIPLLASANTYTGGPQTFADATVANNFINMTDGHTAAVSAANTGNIIYNSGTQTFQVSLNGAAYVNIATGSGGGFPVSSTSGTPQVILTSASSTITGAGNTVAGGSGTLAGTLTSGTVNVLIGASVDVGAANASNAVAIGNAAVTPTGGTVVGNAAGKAGATAAHFTAIGNTAGTAISSGGDNTFVGDHAGAAVATTAQNTFVGSQAGIVNTAAGNTFMGYNAGAANVAGVRCTYIGLSAGVVAAASTDNDNTFVGFQAGLLANGSASGTNTLIGSGSGKAIVTGIKNTFVGSTTGTLCTGSSNTFVGQNAAAITTTGASNVVIGDASNLGALGASNCVAIGSTTVAPTGGTVIGNAAGKASATAARFTCVGNSAGAAITSSPDNTFVGDNAGNAMAGDSSGACTFVGSASGKANTGAFNTFVGKSAGAANTSATSNTYIGFSAGVAASTANDVNNTAVGTAALSNANNSIGGIGSNVAIGYSAAAQLSTGNNNICIGPSSGGAVLGTGLRNILIGLNADTNASGTANAIVISSGLTATKASATSIIINTNGAINSATTNDFIIESGDTGFRRNAANIVGPTNGAGSTGFIFAPSSQITAGTMTVTKNALTVQCIHHFSWTNAMVTALGAVLNGNVSVGTLPAKFVVVNAYVVITTAAGGTTTLTVSVGRAAASYIDYIVASNAQAAANTVYGAASGDRGTNLTGYDLPSYTGTTVVNAHFVSTVSNLSSVTTSTGEIFIEGYVLP